MAKKEKEPTMTDIDIIIPAYGPSKLINKGLASIATSWKVKNIHVTIVNDCSPNTDNDYADLVELYSNMGLDVRCIRTPENLGQGGARQFGIDNTKHKWFMFMDEDDMFATPIAISQFVGTAETYNYVRNPDGTIAIDEKGKIVIDKSVPKFAVISGPLFEFDDNHTHVIESTNTVWLNSKLYNREFLEKHCIRFNTAQSRHAEDYYFTSCLFYALQFDTKYMAIMLNDDGMYYIWYPNSKSQSRVDPDYGYMLSGYTMDGSVNILKYMKDITRHHIKWTKDMEDHFMAKALNMTIYSYYTFLSFIKHVKEDHYIPKLELDWTILRDSCNTLREMVKGNWNEYKWMQIVEELYIVKNMSDVHYVEPWIEFKDYIHNGMEEFNYTYDDIKNLAKEKKK